MGESEMLLCPYRYLEDIMVKLEKLKIQLCFYSASNKRILYCIVLYCIFLLIILLLNRIISCDARSDYPVYFKMNLQKEQLEKYRLFTVLSVHNVCIEAMIDDVAETTKFLADRTNGRAIGTVLRLSVCLSSVVCL